MSTVRAIASSLVNRLPPARAGAHAVCLGLALLVLAGGSGPRSDDALASFEIHSDFTIELVASEPVVLDPVDLEFDERGRAFVLEMPGYPFSKDPGRVVLLRDRDGDGRYDTRTVFAADLAGTADSILPHRRGLLVASPPDLLFLEDEDGDGAADERRVVLSGFANGNPQHNFNGLVHGLDGWIYGVNGGSSGDVFWPDDPARSVPLHDDDFRLDLDARRFERTGESAGGFGMTFDGWGRSFSTHNTEHVSHLVFPGRYLDGLPGSLRRTRHRISDHGTSGPARVFPIGVQETRVNHPEQAGHFSGACGITAYTGGAFGAGFEDNLFVADVVLNLVHRAVVRPRGASVVASRARPRTEFLASRDRSFRPVNMTVGPDGALYVLDMHRDVIEHPEWIPDEIEAGLDLDAGKDRGRVYRIVPRGGLDRARPDLDRARPQTLVAALGHPNKWWRDTAQRLLVEEKATAVAPALAAALRSSENPHQRLHALWTLARLGRLDEDALAAALADAHPRIRENALLVAEPRLGGRSVLVEAALRLVDDPDPRVRLQVALTLGTVPGARTRDALLAIAASDAEDPWTRLAVLGGLDREPFEAARAILERPNLAGREGGRELVRRLAARLTPVEAVSLLGALAAEPQEQSAVVAAALEGLSTGLADAAGGPVALPPAVETWLREQATDGPDRLAREAGRVARAVGLEPSPEQLVRLRRAGADALDAGRATEARLAALDLLELAPVAERRDTLFALLDPASPVPIQLAALRQLTRADDPSAAPRLLEAWRTLGTEARAEAGAFLLERRAHHASLLDGLEDGTVTLGELNLDLERRRALLWSPDESVRRRAGALFGDAGIVTRKEALVRMRPALELEGDAEAGRAVFGTLCARCHRIGGEGAELGPDLTDVSRKGAETLLHEIVDPNAAVETRYVSYTVETRDGRVLSGIVVDETDDRLTVREAGRDTELRRAEIAKMWTGGLSAMPEELETGMEPQAMADLLAFLQQPR